MARVGEREPSGRWVDWIAPFDPKARVRSTWTPNTAFTRAALRAGADPEAANTEVVASAAVPLLDSRDNQPVGQLLGRDYGPWLALYARPDRSQPHFLPVEASSPPEVDYGTVVSAIALSPEAVALLFSGTSTDRVLVSSQAGVHEEWQAPHPTEAAAPHPPALAVNAQQELSVVYTLSGADPASDLDPAVAIDREGGRHPLAPWSTLRPAGAAECAMTPDDLQLVLGTSHRWLAVFNAAAPVTPDSGMFALVRWNAARACLLALETDFDSVVVGSGTLPARMIVRFDNPSATRLAIREGGESRQPLSCRLD